MTPGTTCREVRVRGETSGAIAASLNEDGVRTRTGKRWVPATVLNATKRGPGTVP
jgi:hypothetical protein